MRRYLETIGFRRRLWEIGLKEVSRRLCERCYGNASTRKCLKKKRKPLKNRFFETFPQFLQEKRKSLKTQFLRGFHFSPDNYFWGISQYFWGISQYFWGISAKFLRRFRFLKKVFKLYFVEAFPLFIEAFPFFLIKFVNFICWGISSSSLLKKNLVPFFKNLFPFPK